MFHWSFCRLSEIGPRLIVVCFWYLVVCCRVCCRVCLFGTGTCFVMLFGLLFGLLFGALTCALFDCVLGYRGLVNE